MLPKQLLVATRSTGKLRELMPMCAEHGIEAVGLDAVGVAESGAEDALEVHATFEENALAKARYFHELTGLPTLADDSGLAVAALGGRPGVLSKRWSGRSDLTGQALDDENNRLLQERLAGTSERSAAYICVAAFVDHGREATARGEVRGRIIVTPRGSEGFGYDPYFLSDELGRTFGEANRAEKARVSHRGRAVSALFETLSAG